MNKQEILAAIQQLEEQLAVLKSLVLAEESVNVSSEETHEIPVINEDEDITLPDPPAEVTIDMPEETMPCCPDYSSMSYKEEVVLGCKILTIVGTDFYKGKCAFIRVHKQYFDNGKPKLYINKYKVVVTAFDIDGEFLGEIIVHWDFLKEVHLELIKLGINTHSKDNWMPKVITLFTD